MSKPSTLKSVVEHGLCTGCGICESLIGRDTVEMKLTSYGHLRPRFKGVIEDKLEAKVLDICPGAVAVVPSSTDGEVGAIHPVWGPIVSIHRSWAADPAIRHRAAAGGTLTAHAADYATKRGSCHYAMLPDHAFDVCQTWIGYFHILPASLGQAVDPASRSFPSRRPVPDAGGALFQPSEHSRVRPLGYCPGQRRVDQDR